MATDYSKEPLAYTPLKDQVGMGHLKPETEVAAIAASRLSDQDLKAIETAAGRSTEEGIALTKTLTQRAAQSAMIDVVFSEPLPTSTGTLKNGFAGREDIKKLSAIAKGSGGRGGGAL